MRAERLIVFLLSLVSTTGVLLKELPESWIWIMAPRFGLLATIVISSNFPISTSIPITDTGVLSDGGRWLNSPQGYNRTAPWWSATRGQTCGPGSLPPSAQNSYECSPTQNCKLTKTLKNVVVVVVELKCMALKHKPCRWHCGPETPKG